LTDRGEAVYPQAKLGIVDGQREAIEDFRRCEAARTASEQRAVEEAEQARRRVNSDLADALGRQRTLVSGAEQAMSLARADLAAVSMPALAGLLEEKVAGPLPADAEALSALERSVAGVKALQKDIGASVAALRAALEAQAKRVASAIETASFLGFLLMAASMFLWITWPYSMVVGTRASIEAAGFCVGFAMATLGFMAMVARTKAMGLALLAGLAGTAAVIRYFTMAPSNPIVLVFALRVAICSLASPLAAGLARLVVRWRPARASLLAIGIPAAVFALAVLGSLAVPNLGFAEGTAASWANIRQTRHETYYWFPSGAAGGGPQLVEITCAGGQTEVRLYAVSPGQNVSDSTNRFAKYELADGATTSLLFDYGGTVDVTDGGRAVTQKWPSSWRTLTIQLEGGGEYEVRVNGRALPVIHSTGDTATIKLTPSGD